MKPPADWDNNAFWLALAKGAGLLGAATGAIVLLGWQLDSALLKSIAPQWVSMKANTAMGLVLSGMALWLKADRPTRDMGAIRVARYLLAGLVVSLGALSLFEYLADVDLGFDHWLFQEPLGTIGTLAPGRMAPATALCFVLLGAALMLDGKTGRSRQVVSALAVSTAILALAGGLIYLYDTDNAYGLGYFLQLAAHTVLAFLVLAAGLLCSQPEDGVVALLRRHDSGGALARRLLPVSLLLPILIGWLKLSGEHAALYEPDFGVALVALGYIAMLSTLVVWGARFLARIEHEREWMHASVAVSEARLRTLVSTIPDMIWLKDPDGVYLACNPAFERFFGAKEADIVGKTDYDFVPRELADFFRANDRAAIAVGGPSRNEEWITLADSGQLILAETTKTPMFGRQGELLGVLGIARDVTQRHESEAAIRAAKVEADRLLAEANQSRQALLSALEDSRVAARALQQSEASARLSRERYASLFAAIGDAAYVHEILEDGAPGRFIEVNEVASEMTGYAREELLYMTPQQLDAPDSGDLVPVMQRLMLQGAASYERVHLARDGRHIPVEINAHLFMLGGKPAVISLARDISDRKQAEAALHESNALLHAFIEHSPIYAFIKSVTPGESRTVMASENFRDMIGIPGSEMAGKTMVELFPPDFAAKITADDWAVASGGEVLHLDEDLNGRSYTTVKFPIHVGGKNYLAGYTIDITERKQLMGELEQHRARLEEMVAARTRELQAANKELEAFSYSVSHDLRAPLRAISGFVELLKKHDYDAVDDKGRHYMEVISASAVQMGRLIDDILTFSRIGRAEMAMTRVNLNQVLGEVLDILRPQTEGRRIEWKIAPLPEVAGERGMLALVLQNLVSNALKFTQTRQVAIVEIGQLAGAENEVVCYVRDNGVGFDMRHVDKLFGLFQRLHPQEQFEGTGVGLANVQRIVQRHGGRVWAEGRVNEGATFYFALPKTGGRDEYAGADTVGRGQPAR
ncbi:MAG TPA: PAS domain S-box protein [Gallionella sp.]|nr:PAS domain S-box protein [Gallionella sp.]